MMKIGAVIQARTSSTRFPGKVLKELPKGSGITVLQQIIRRLKNSRRITDIIVATSVERSDDGIIPAALRENVKVFRGSLNDVLERYYQAARENRLDVVVRITADCPCIDPRIVDLVIDRHLEAKSDFTCNVLKRTYPDGLDVEVMGFKALEKVHKKADQPREREHVTAYVYGHQDEFNINNVESQKELFAPEMRITLDTPRDYETICAVYEALYDGDHCFDARSIVEFVKKGQMLSPQNS